MVSELPEKLTRLVSELRYMGFDDKEITEIINNLLLDIIKILKNKNVIHNS